MSMAHIRAFVKVVTYWVVLVWSGLAAAAQQDSLRDTRTSPGKPPHLVFAIHEDEYQAAKTLPRFAQRLTDAYGCRCSVLLGRDDSGIAGLEVLKTADVLVLYVRRRALPGDQMALLRQYLNAGKPLVALRTSSHAFAVRGTAPAGMEQWVTFDPDVLGGNYHGHAANALGTDVAVAPGAAGHPILARVQPTTWHSSASLYLVSPIDSKATVLLLGSAQGKTEPVAWTRSYRKARVFYTSLGHPDDFDQPPFCTLLVNAIYWAMGRPVPEATKRTDQPTTHHR